MIGTPELTIVPRVLVNFATETFLTSGPTIGALSARRSIFFRPPGVA